MMVVGLMGLLSFRADRRLDPADWLPMQWDLDGQPTWSAPRRVALFFTPALAALILTSLLWITSPVGDSMLGAVPLLVIVCFAFVAAHLLHLSLLAQRQKPGSHLG
ncbi:hypothetical protein [Rhodocista pekingensis]|uniref:DUF1648 domain-containing protein n=1 Tax=Rhodocista pekingensis TaxID=201185 RepID=A0ABW2KNH2_9PROT